MLSISGALGWRSLLWWVAVPGLASVAPDQRAGRHLLTGRQQNLAGQGGGDRLAGAYLDAPPTQHSAGGLGQMLIELGQQPRRSVQVANRPSPAQRQRLAESGVADDRIFLGHGDRYESHVARTHQAFTVVRADYTLGMPELDRFTRSVPDARSATSAAAVGIPPKPSPATLFSGELSSAKLATPPATGSTKPTPSTARWWAASLPLATSCASTRSMRSARAVSQNRGNRPAFMILRVPGRKDRHSRRGPEATPH
jgi:hypothetical protein